MQEDNINKMRQLDHDNLIEVRTIVIGLASDMKELKDGIAARLLALETAIETLKVKNESSESKWRLAVFLFAPIYLGLAGWLVASLLKLIK